MGVDQKGAAFYAFDLLAVHDFVFHHAKHMAQLFFGVGDQLKRQLQRGLELFVRRHVVARHAKHHRTCLDEIFMVVAEGHAFGGAAGCVVFGVEIQNHNLTDISQRRELHAPGCKRFKFRESLVDSWRHG